MKRKNPNKLATIDKQIQELQGEISRMVRPNSQITTSELSLALSNLNCRIRSCGLSSYEQWHRRDQFNSKEIQISDKSLIKHQEHQRLSTRPQIPSDSNDSFQIGSIVYIINEKTKHQPRPRYIVDKIDGSWLFLRKLTDTQLRSKIYKIHRNACIKLKESTPAQHYEQSDSKSSESDEDSSDNNPTNSGQCDTGAPETNIETDPNQPSDTGSRPRRAIKPPAWLKDYHY